MNKPSILVIDDEPQIRKLLNIVLVNNGFKVSNAATGMNGISLAASNQPDLILLDIGLPDKNGMEVLRELRQWYFNPILILSVQNKEEDIVGALDQGADDYITKPFRTGELLARIRTSLRRQNSSKSISKLVSGIISIDFEARTVLCKGDQLKLTIKEYNLLSLFVKNDGKVLTHGYLLKEIWGAGFQFETQYLRVFVGQLRKKIEDDPNEPKHILTESGVGYRFVSDPSPHG
jgi:two-component system, OmpR family, KDP operon response regulator KdpE